MPQLVIVGIYLNTMGLPFQGNQDTSRDTTQDDVLSVITLTLSILSLVYNMVEICVGCRNWNIDDTGRRDTATTAPQRCVSNTTVDFYQVSETAA